MTEFIDKLIVEHDMDYPSLCIQEMKRIHLFIKNYKLYAEKPKIHEQKQPTLTHNNVIQCPYCEKEQNDTLDDLVEIGEMDGDFEHNCEYCRESFTVEFEYRPYHRTDKL